MYGERRVGRLLTTGLRPRAAACLDLGLAPIHGAR
eukprot:COSAG06_NODE_2742_length_6358_cov_3.976035_5_plen_35_part_00